MLHIWNADQKLQTMFWGAQRAAGETLLPLGFSCPTPILCFFEFFQEGGLKSRGSHLVFT